MVKTLADQLEAAKLTWKGYMEDMGNNPARESATCGHVPPGAEERTSRATVNDKYAAKHDPFVYFHSIIDDQSRCDAHVVNLDQLPTDLRSVATTPNYSLITPNLCNDGHDAHCVDGGLGGFQAIYAFLQKWVPLVMNSPAFQKDGLLIITFDESDSIGDDAATACCAEQGLPGAEQPAGVTGPGGGRIGAVLLSPFIEPGTVSTVSYNHYSTLRYVEDTFGLAHLGYAGQKGLKVFGSDVFTRPARSVTSVTVCDATSSVFRGGLRIRSVIPISGSVCTMLRSFSMRRRGASRSSLSTGRTPRTDHERAGVWARCAIGWRRPAPVTLPYPGAATERPRWSRHGPSTWLASAGRSI